MSVYGDDDDVSLRRELLAQFSNEVMEDDPAQQQDEFGDGDSLMPEDEEGPLDFSTGGSHVVSSSSEDEEDEEVEEQEPNPLRRLIKVNVSV